MESLTRWAFNEPMTRETPNTGETGRRIALRGGHGLPATGARMLAGMVTERSDGGNARFSEGVRQALGRSPRDFAGNLRTTAAAGARSPR